MIRLESVLKKSLQDALKMSWRRLEDVIKTSRRRLEYVLKTSWKRLEDVLKTYDQDEYIGLDQDVLKTSWKRLLKTYEYSEYVRLDQDVFWRRTREKFSRRLHQRRMFAGNVLQNRYLKKFENFTGKHLCWSLFLI